MPSGPSERPIHIDDKIAAQLAIRGWTEQQIREAVARPPIGTSTDNTEGRADPATVYGARSGGYLGKYILDKSGGITESGGQQGRPLCLPTFTPPCSQTRTPLAKRLKLSAGRMVPFARIADRSSVSL